MLIRSKPVSIRAKATTLLLAAILTPASLVCAESTTVSQTKSKLKQLDNQINKLKQTLASAHDKQGTLNQELASTEKQIGEGVRQLRSINADMQSKQRKITSLQQHVVILNKQLTAQQQLLAQHIRARHKMGEYQPIQWIINQDDPYTINRLLTFYQYLVRSRQHIIDEIDTTKKNITLNQAKVQQELAEQQALQDKLHSRQQQLEQDKHYHKAVIDTLRQNIQSNQHTLSEFERNKENLSQLLKTLATQSVISARLPFTKMRHKLPRPVHVAITSVLSMNQGVTFFAGEGTPVHAVYPGKVVFSDWLNGYGLLLIIDHGQGFMTLYAHNQSLFKHKGAAVAQGESIAAVGHSGGIKQTGLYFEVRQRGKAVPPLDWLT